MIITKDKPFWSLQIYVKYKPDYLLVLSRPAGLIFMEDHIESLIGYTMFLSIKIESDNIWVLKSSQYV